LIVVILVCGLKKSRTAETRQVYIELDVQIGQEVPVAIYSRKDLFLDMSEQISGHALLNRQVFGWDKVMSRRSELQNTPLAELSRKNCR
jgi:hypothetical protein